MTFYLNTTPSQPISAYPRAVYRAVVGRSGLTALSFATGALRWRQVVEVMIDRSTGAAGFPLGGGLDTVTNADTRAVVDYRAGSHPGALVVADLARQIEDATPYSSLLSLTRLPPVPALADGGAAALGAERDAVQDAAEVESAANSFTGRVTSGLSGLAGLAGSVAKYAAWLLVAGAVVAVVLIYRPRAST